MSRLPNILSLFRIVGGITLLLCDAVGTTFWMLYSLCGLSDKADGWLARKLKCETKTGVFYTHRKLLKLKQMAISSQKKSYFSEKKLKKTLDSSLGA